MKISIIIPNYNNYNYIEKCINSILSQSYQNFEIIIVDDGSSDNSLNFIKQICKENDKISIISQFNQNGAVARNRGLEIAKGDFVFFLDSDDYLYDKNVLEQMISKIENYDLLITNYYVVDNECKRVDVYNNQLHLLKNVDNIFKFANLSPVPSNKLYRKSIIDEYNIYFDNVRIGQDLNFYLKYLSVTRNIIVDKMISYNYRLSPKSVSRSINYNFIDIINNFNYIKNFYKKIGKEDFFLHYISLVQLLHYKSQLEKVKMIKNNYSKRTIIRIFSNNIKMIDYKKCYDVNIFKREKMKFIIKKWLFYYYM